MCVKSIGNLLYWQIEVCGRVPLLYLGGYEQMMVLQR